ncbi:MAG: macro domain-containing protein [Carboxydocellales bacterium]
MLKFLKKSNTWALSIITIVFTFVPETIFGKCKLLLNASDEANVVLTRVLAFIAMLVISIIINALYLLCRRSIRIKGNNYSIQIKYGDLLKMRACKKVIPFDECFTTSVGYSPSDINPDSICGQYLEANPIQDMQSLIDNAQLKSAKSKSKYQNKERYDSGKLVPNGDYLLMAFAKLDKDGLGRFFSRDEFLDCLSMLWEEIDKYYGQKDVCIPVLGSGVTRMDGTSLTQQELLDIIIGSYRLSAHKIKYPCQLHIVCKKRDDFSLNKIGENM